MALIIYQFGLTDLPWHAPTWDDSPAVEPRTIATLGGHYDAAGGQTVSAKLPRPITVSALALAADRSALGATIDDYRAQLGVLERLWAHPFNDATVDRWCWARLRQVIDRGSYKDRRWQQMELLFDATSYWYGGAHGGSVNPTAGHLYTNGLYYTVDDDFTVGDNNTPYLPNLGNRMITDCGITYTCNTGGGVSLVTLTTARTELAFGPVAEHDVWRLDCGAKTITCNDVAAYQYFELTAAHASPHWFEIAGGGETPTISNAGGADHVQFTYADGWQ